MDSTTFIEIAKALVELVKALAWPVAFFMVVRMFKDKFAKLIDRLKDLDGLGVKASFGEEVKKVEAEVEQLKVEANLNVQDEPDTLEATAHVGPLHDLHGPVDPPSSADLNKPIVNYLLLTANPASGFELGRVYLERALADHFLKMTGNVAGLLMPMDAVVDKLEEGRYLTAKMRRTIKDLLSLGSQAVHGKFEPNVESAMSYVNAVQSTVDLMNERAKRLSA